MSRTDDAPRSPVDDELSCDQHLRGRRRAPSQECTNAREQLFVGEGAADDVVGAAVERTHALDRIRRGREQDDGNVPVPCTTRFPPPQPQAQVELGEQHDIRANALGELERLAPPRRPEHVEAVVAEVATEILACLGLRLCDQDGTRHAADASRVLRDAPDVLCGESVSRLPQPAWPDEAARSALRGARAGARPR